MHFIQLFITLLCSYDKRVTLEWLRRRAGAKGFLSLDRSDQLAFNGGDLGRVEEAAITGIRSEGGNVTYIVQQDGARPSRSGLETAAQVRCVHKCRLVAVTR